MSKRAKNAEAAATKLIVLCSIPLCAFAARQGSQVPDGLDPGKPIAELQQDVWGTDQGLPQNTIPAIAQSRDGYLWFGTELGLVRFDGMRFTVFDRTNTPELRSSKIDALLEDRNGDLWIGTVGGGLTRLQGRKFTNFS